MLKRETSIFHREYQAPAPVVQGKGHLGSRGLPGSLQRVVQKDPRCPGQIYQIHGDLFHRGWYVQPCFYSKGLHLIQFGQKQAFQFDHLQAAEGTDDLL